MNRRLPGPGFTAPWSPAIRPAVQEDPPMLTFIIQGRYAQEAMRGMAASPSLDISRAKVGSLVRERVVIGI